MHSPARFTLLALLATVGFAAPAVEVESFGHSKSCPILFDGRVNLFAKASDFDKDTSVYNAKYDLGANQTWAEVLKFPAVLPSLFDIKRLNKAFGVTISDRSIFAPGGPPGQLGFRRSELMPAIDGEGNATTVQGTTTLHWSVRTDPARPLNYTHEYHAVWHELADYSSSQFTVNLGKPFDKAKDPKVKQAKSIRITGLQAKTPQDQFFEAPFTSDVWHNFGLTVGWVDNTITVYYSTGYSVLKRVGKVNNNNAGGGAFHVGLLKLPTGPVGIDVVNEGYQPKNINEGLIFGGVFIEDSSRGCVTTSLLD